MIISEYTQDGTLVSDISRGSDKKILSKCDWCGKERWCKMNQYVRRTYKEDLCHSCAIKKWGKTRIGIKSTLKGRKRADMTGSNNPNYAGGIYMSSDGYIMIRNNEKYTGKGRVGWSLYSKLHKVVMESYLGRKLVKGEVIHHIDFNKLNNTLDNLFLCKSESEHRNIHASFEKQFSKLISDGLIIFNTETKKYEMAHIKLRELLETPEEDNQQPS